MGVDTDIDEHASGAAAEMAARHAAEQPLKLYGAWFCPFVQRAWVVLAEKRIAHQYVETNPYRKTAALLELNPRGLVPTLAVPVHEATGKHQKPLHESTVVCEFLDEAFADEAAHGRRLLPQEDAYQRARCRLWIDHIGTKVVPAWYRFMQHQPEKPYSIEEAREGFWAHVKALVREMGEGGPWFLGDRFSLVDIMLVPWAKRLYLIDYYKPGGVGIPPVGKRGEDEEVWARWETWFEAATKRQSVLETWSLDEHYIKVYKRYAEDTTQSEVAKATRVGGRLP